jgi:hypothetical protein
LDGLTPLQNEFLDWLMTDPREREPLTQNGWAREHDISSATLSDWKRKDPFFQSALKARVAEAGLDPAMLHRIIQAQADKAAQGDTNAAKVVFGYVQWLNPTPPKADEIPIESMSDAELAQELRDAAEALDS